MVKGAEKTKQGNWYGAIDGATFTFNWNISSWDTSINKTTIVFLLFFLLHSFMIGSRKKFIFTFIAFIASSCNFLLFFSTISASLGFRAQDLVVRNLFVVMIVMIKKWTSTMEPQIVRTLLSILFYFTFYAPRTICNIGPNLVESN